MRKLILTIWFIIGYIEGHCRYHLRRIMGRHGAHKNRYIPGQVSKIVREMDAKKKKKKNEKQKTANRRLGNQRYIDSGSNHNNNNGYNEMKLDKPDKDNWMGLNGGPFSHYVIRALIFAALYTIYRIVIG